MTPKMAAIFGAETGDSAIVAPAVASAVAPAAEPIGRADPRVAPTVTKAGPIIEGTEHFSLWVYDPDGPWPEFITGVHFDCRQPSRLRGLCAVRPDK